MTCAWSPCLKSTCQRHTFTVYMQVWPSPPLGAPYGPGLKCANKCPDVVHGETKVSESVASWHRLSSKLTWASFPYLVPFGHPVSGVPTPFLLFQHTPIFRKASRECSLLLARSVFGTSILVGVHRKQDSSVPWNLHMLPETGCAIAQTVFLWACT